MRQNNTKRKPGRDYGGTAGKNFPDQYLFVFLCVAGSYQAPEKRRFYHQHYFCYFFPGSNHLMDYSATKGAITTFTRSLSQNLAKDGIRVNAVAPGPIWTPLIPATLSNVEDFGKSTPLGRVGQPSEVAPAYVFWPAKMGLILPARLFM
jgi:NAD(P)-dependent dehydrogenase (short-subunit alcohol dehydrogenase family)